MQEIKVLSAYRKSLRERILDTAMCLFTERGIRAVKMDDIAHALSISKRTLYEIYDNKEQVLLEGSNRLREAHQRQMEADIGRDANVMDIVLYIYRLKIEEFHRVNPLFYSDLGRYPKLLESFRSERERTRQQFLDFMQQGVSEGYFRSDINFELVGKLFEVQSDYMMKLELYRSYPIEELFRNMLMVSLRGICTKKGVEKLDTFLA